jgi:CelD/BcsL family acetyltransferase involved in cellulose biosynthesis
MTSLASDCLVAEDTAVTAAVTELAADAASRAALGERWLALEARAAPSFFCSWGWIGSWLAVLPPERRRLLVEIADGERPAAMAIVVPGARRLFRLVTLPIALLQDSSVESERTPTIEHNGLLALRGREAEPALWSALWQALRRNGIAELRIPFVARSRFAPPAGADLRRYASDPAPFIDLAVCRREGRVADALLGRNGREQLRRCRKAYAARGRLSLTAAASVAEAHDYLARLARLHQATWIARGKPGSFASPFFVAFHRTLIERRFGAGEIELLRVSAGAEEVGYLYNFRYRDRIYAYQSGLAYEEDPRLKPGLVCHALAIDRAAADPALRIYDFLAGDSRFKRSFANGVEPLDSWAVAAQHPLIRLENTVKKMLIQSPAGKISV